MYIRVSCDTLGQRVAKTRQDLQSRKSRTNLKKLRPARIREKIMVKIGKIGFTNIKVFSTTVARDREMMGENISRWIKENPRVEILETIVGQTSGGESHCLSITFFYRVR